MIRVTVSGKSALLATGLGWVSALVMAAVIVIDDSPNAKVAEAALLTAAVLGGLLHGAAIVLGLTAAVRTRPRGSAVAALGIGGLGLLAAALAMLFWMESAAVSGRGRRSASSSLIQPSPG